MGSERALEPSVCEVVEMKTISLTNSDKKVLVDDEDYERLSVFRWFIIGDRYVRRTAPRGSSIYMHREIAGTPAGFDTDHINGDKLDNRRCNLRIATRAQNCANTFKYTLYAGKTPSSRFKGVTWDKNRNKWSVKTRVNKSYVFIGRFHDEVLAAKAYDKFMYDRFGEFAKLNNP